MCLKRVKKKKLLERHNEDICNSLCEMLFLAYRKSETQDPESGPGTHTYDPKPRTLLLGHFTSDLGHGTRDFYVGPGTWDPPLEPFTWDLGPYMWEPGPNNFKWNAGPILRNPYINTTFS